MARLSIFTLCAGILTLAGCADMKGIVTRSTHGNPGSLATDKSLANVKLSPAAWPRTDWWKQFNDPQLDQLMAEALTGSPTLRMAEARVRRALAFAQTSQAALSPQLSANSQITQSCW